MASVTSAGRSGWSVPSRFRLGLRLKSAIVWPRAALGVHRRWSSLAGRTVLVTGASSGIGRAAAELLAASGANVIVLARQRDVLDQVVAQISADNGSARAVPCDLADPKQVDAALTELAGCRLDAVVSNAGVSYHRSVYEAAERRDLERSIAVNVTGPAQLLMGLVPRMIAAGGGTIVNVSTVSAKPPPAPRWGSYQSTKSAFDIWLRSAAAEWRNDRVIVRSVYMPLVTTPMTTAGGLYPTAPALTSDEAATIVVGALVGGRARVAPWWLVWQDLAATAVPSLFDRVFHAQMRRRARRRVSGRASE